MTTERTRWVLLAAPYPSPMPPTAKPSREMAAVIERTRLAVEEWVQIWSTSPAIRQEDAK